MILALEAAESWRLTCSECNDNLRRKRGCHKPGYSVPLSGLPFRFDSPALQPKPDGKDGIPILYECPTGFILREAPWTYDVIDAAGRDENLSPAHLNTMSVYYHHAARLVRSERERLRARRESQRKGTNAATHAANVLKQVR